MKILRKKKILEIKKCCSRNGPIGRIDTAEKTALQYQDILIESSKIEKQRTNLRKSEQNIQTLWDNYKRCNIRVWDNQKEKKQRKEQKK